MSAASARSAGGTKEIVISAPLPAERKRKPLAPFVIRLPHRDPGAAALSRRSPSIAPFAFEAISNSQTDIANV
jgi:hypothetical protein